MKAKTIFFQNCLGVFQGGGCRGAAFVGAYKEAIERNVSFAELVGTSAGSIVAAFIAAGASPEKLEKIMANLNFSKLLEKPEQIKNFRSSWGHKVLSSVNRDLNRIIKNAGIYSSDALWKWIDMELKTLLGKKESIQFDDLVIPITIVVTDLQSKKVKLYGNNYDDSISVSEAVRRSCNIPIFFQPISKRYIDGGLLSNLPSFVFKNQQETSYEKVLAFALVGDENTGEDFNNIESYIALLASTVVDGSVDMQLVLQKNIHIIKIPTGSIKATDFTSITPKETKFLVERGQEITSHFFDNELGNIKHEHRRADINYDSSKAYNELTLSVSNTIKEVIFSDFDTDWVYELFPTIITWVSKKSAIIIIVKKNNDRPYHGAYRQKLLETLGCEVLLLDELPMRGIIINGNDPDTAKSIVFNDTKEGKGYHSKSYYGDADYRVISLLRETCFRHVGSKTQKIDLSIQAITNKLLFNKLKNVWQYNKPEVTFELREVEIEQLTFLTKYIPGFKYRQIPELFKMFRINNLEHFVPAQLNMPGQKKSFITPPIIEIIGSLFIVVEGNTRLTYAYKNEIKKMKVIFVQGVIEPLPSTGRFKINQMLISDKTIKGEDRYENWNYSQFRKIESAVRNPEISIAEDL